MDDFQQFLENLSKTRLDERVHVFRHEALRPLTSAKGYAALLQRETKGCSEMSEEAQQWFQKLLSNLEEIEQLLDALVDQDEEG